MLSGTRRDVLEAVINEPQSATDIAETLDKSVQTISRHLSVLADTGYVREAGTKPGRTRPYTLYEPTEAVRVFGVVDDGNALLDRTIPPSPFHRVVWNVLRVPQPEYHAVVWAALVSGDLAITDPDVEGAAVSGSVARGDARAESDVDVLYLVGADSDAAADKDATELVAPLLEPAADRVMVSSRVLTASDLQAGLDADSQFIRSAFGEAVIVYDPAGTLHDVQAAVA
jgi:DNA-binding transcriptional ArsR family regulator